MDTDRDLVTMQDLIVGRLSDEERRAFEDRLVQEPELAQEFEQSLRMREGFRQLRAQGYFTKAPYRGRSFRIWAPVLAAAAAAGLALFLWLPRAAGPAPILMPSLGSRAVTDLATVGAHFTFVAMRGSSVPDLDLPSAGLIEIRLAPTTRDTDHPYRVTLVRQQGEGPAEPVADLTGLALSTDGYVHCFADATRLTPGSYVLRMQPDADSSAIEEAFPFSLRARGDAALPR